MLRKTVTVVGALGLALVGVGLAAPATAGTSSGYGNCAAQPGRMVVAQGVMRANGSMTLTAPSVRNAEVRNLRTGDRANLRGLASMGVWSVSSPTTPFGSFGCL